HPVGGAAMPTLPPHLGLVDPASEERLDGGADALASRRHFEETGGVVTVDAIGVELASHRLEGGDGAAKLLEHASSGRSIRPGKLASRVSNVRSGVNPGCPERGGCGPPGRDSPRSSGGRRRPWASGGKRGRVP